MIERLYNFTEGTFVVASEWNANFNVLNQSNYECSVSVGDAYNALAFSDSDLSQLFRVVNLRANSFAVVGNNVVIQPECEYYKALASGEDLNIQIPTNFNAEARIAISIPDNRELPPFSVNYGGKKLEINTGLYNIFNAGKYFILIYETAGELAQVKLIWTRG